MERVEEGIERIASVGNLTHRESRTQIETMTGVETDEIAIGRLLNAVHMHSFEESRRRGRQVGVGSEPPSMQMP